MEDNSPHMWKVIGVGIVAMICVGALPAIAARAQSESYLLGFFYGVGIVCAGIGVMRSRMFGERPETRFKAMWAILCVIGLLVSLALWIGNLIEPNWLYHASE